MSSIKKQLKKIRVATLTKQEQAKIWKQVYLGMAQTQKTPIHSRLHLSLVKKLVATTLIFGMTTGTAFAADSARPGDFLFPLDRAMEKTHLSVVSKEKKDILKVRFALERVGEMKDIVNEIKTKTKIKRAEKSELVVITPIYNKPIEKPTEIVTPVEVSAPEEIIAEENEESPVEENALTATDEELATGSAPVLPNASTTQNNLLEQNIASTSVSSLESSENASEKDIKNEQNTTKINNILEENGTTTSVKYVETQLVEIEQEYTDISDNDKKRIELALGTTLDFLGDIKGELAEQGNSEAVSSVNNLLEELNSEINNLPKNISFEVKLSPTKKSVKFEITSKNDKNGVQISVPIGDDTLEIKDNEKENSDPAKPPVPTDTQLEIKNDILKIKTGGDVLTPKEAEAILKELDTPAPPRPTNKEGDYQIETGQNLEEIGVTIINNGSTTVENLDAGLIMINTGSTTVVEEVDDIEKNKEPTTTESAGLKLNKIDDDTTTVKMILENTENTFNFSAIDNNSNLHKIIEEYTNLKKENPVLQDAG